MTIYNPDVADRSGQVFFTGPLDVGTEVTSPATLKKSFIAEATILPRRLVKFGAGGVTILQGAAATDLIIGVTANTASVVAGGSVDVILSGEATVTAGAAVAAGALLTSDATGRAVTAVATNRSTGPALAAAAAADATFNSFVSICTA